MAMFPRPSLVCLLSVAVLGGCSTTPEPLAEGGEAKAIGSIPGFTTTVGPAKDWVAASRPGTFTHIPVGVTPADRPSVAKTPEQIAAAQSELQGVGQGSASIANRPVPPSAIVNAASVEAALAEQRRRLAAAGLSGKLPGDRETDLRKSAAQSRNFAMRPLPNAPATAPKDQPTSWPVSEAMRARLRGYGEQGKGCPPEDTTASAGKENCKTQ
jgi:hypothetical protein